MLLSRNEYVTNMTYFYEITRKNIQILLYSHIVYATTECLNQYIDCDSVICSISESENCYVSKGW